jgi:hypothetical protein
MLPKKNRFISAETMPQNRPYLRNITSSVDALWLIKRGKAVSLVHFLLFLYLGKYISSEFFKGLWVPCYHGMARPQVAD